MSMQTHGPRHLTRAVTVVSVGVWVRALASRLTRTCWSRVGSAIWAPLSDKLLPSLA